MAMLEYRFAYQDWTIPSKCKKSSPKIKPKSAVKDHDFTDHWCGMALDIDDWLIDWNMTEKDTEACKREKDWTERRKYDSVDENSRFKDEDFAQENNFLHRYDSSFTCWNGSPLSRFMGKTYKDFNGCEVCCCEYQLHKIFTGKESRDKMLNSSTNSTSPLVMSENTSKNRIINEDQVSNKPTLIRQNGGSSQWCSRSPKVTPRRSVLKSHATLVNSAILSAHSFVNPLLNATNSGTTTSNSRQESTRTIKNLESDGDSPRSASPQSSEVDEEESIFGRNGRNVHEKLSDYISEGAASASRESENEGRGQQVGRRAYIRRRKEKENEVSMENDIKRNPLSDHCYHQSRSLERLRSETFSETDEEIDVVSYEKKTTYLNIAQKQHDANQLALNFPQRQHNASQLALNFAQKQHDANQLTLSFAQKQHNANQLANIDKTVVRRPRGRPPGPNSAKRKRAAQISLNETCDSSPKRITRVQPYQRRQKRQKSRQWRNQTSDDDEEDKRNLHNNMERQRRISMKNYFEELKAQVPSIAKKERVAKVTILRESAAYIDSLLTTNSCQKLEEDEQKRINVLLKKKLAKLKEEVANRTHDPREEDPSRRMRRLQRRY